MLLFLFNLNLSASHVRQVTPQIKNLNFNFT